MSFSLKPFLKRLAVKQFFEKVCDQAIFEKVCGAAYLTYNPDLLIK
jgi:hypothetical protein